MRVEPILACFLCVFLAVGLRADEKIEPGYVLPDAAKRANNAFHEDGVPDQQRRPSFKVPANRGTMRVAIVLLEWTDYRHKPKHTKEAFEQIFFSKDAHVGKDVDGSPVYGSVNDFYREMSYGKCRVEGKVFDWVELEGPRQRWLDMKWSSKAIPILGAKAVLKKHGEKALDGFDAYAFIWAGPPVSRISILWPMATGYKGKRAVKLSELYGGKLCPIGVPAHEFAHTFGMKDKYTSGKSGWGMGKWCLIAYGTHGHAPSGVARPLHLCPWCKEVIGWVKPVVIDPRVHQKLALRAITSGPRQCYKVLEKEDGSEYYLLENRQRTGFSGHIPTTGLFIYKVGKVSHGIAPREAHGIKGPDTRKYARYAAFPQLGATSFTPESNPSSRSVGKNETDAKRLEVRITNIRHEGGVIYFEIGKKQPEKGIVHDGKTFDLATSKPGPTKTTPRWDVASAAEKGAKLGPFTADHGIVISLGARIVRQRFFRSRRPYKYRYQGMKIFVSSVHDALRENSQGATVLGGAVYAGTKAEVRHDPMSPVALEKPVAEYRKGETLDADRIAAEIIPKLKLASEGLFLVMPDQPAEVKGDGVYAGRVGKTPYLLICGGARYHDTGRILRQYLAVTEKPVKVENAGAWCLMGAGWRGGPDRKGTRPFHVCAPRKVAFGWVLPKTYTLTDGVVRVALRAIEVFGDMARVRVGEESLILENRARTSLDEEIPREGLLIWHVRADGSATLVGGDVAKAGEQSVKLGERTVTVAVAYDANGNALATIR